jgi:uroporphyrinogen-III synthase
MLQGKIIINTRPDGVDDQIGVALEALGAKVIAMPLIEIIPMPISYNTKLDIVQNNVYQWVVFTSRNGVDLFFHQIEWNQDILSLPFKTAVFGERTALALKEKGYNPDLVNVQNRAEDLSKELFALLHPDEKVLLVLGNLASDLMQEQLRVIVHVDRLNVYRTTFVQSTHDDIVQRIVQNRYDMIIFTSPSGVRSFLHHTDGIINLRELKAACIGTTTERTLLKAGISPLVVANPSGKTGLIKGIEGYFANSFLGNNDVNA